MSPSTAHALLAADGPDPEHADALMLFGRLVGAWDVLSRELGADGAWRERRGEWHWGWVLGGRGVQDVLFEVGAAARERGTSLRVLDVATGTWRVTWYCPAAGEYVHLEARAEGDGVVLDGRAAVGDQRERWRFTAIGERSFTWEGRRSEDGGRSWLLDHVMQATRAA